MDDMQPTMSIDEHNDIVWKLGGLLHRTDGPAVEWHDSGDKFWMVCGKFHRTDGPAIERTNGGKEWYLNDVYLTFDCWLDQNTEISDEEKVMLKLKYG